MKISFLDDEPEIFPIQYGGKARTILTLAKNFVLQKNVEKVNVLSRSINDPRDKFEWNGLDYWDADRRHHKISQEVFLRSLLEHVDKNNITYRDDCREKFWKKQKNATRIHSIDEVK